MSSLVGVIVPHVMSTVSTFKMIPCDGGTYNKSDYPLLYDAIDTVYIVSGTQFTVPDLRERVPIGEGTGKPLNSMGGSDEITLTINQIPQHSHGYNQPTFGIDVESVGVPDPTGVGNPPLNLQTSSVGGGQPHSNLQPYTVVKYAIIAG